MKLLKLLENAISEIPAEDKKDAIGVYHDWCFHNRVQFGFSDSDRIFEKYYAQGKIEELEVSKINTHHDWGRRTDSKTPPIVMRLKNDVLIVLDGQHRIFTAKDKGVNTLKCFVINLPIRYSKPTKRYLLDE